MKATRLWVSMMGAWMGLAGIEHGIGEILQGNQAPEGIMIQSWPGSAFFQNLSGEPALTILPNLLYTGLLAVFFSLLFVAWSIFGAHRQRGGWVLMLLAIPMLLFGGGIFPPLLGFLIGAAATRIPAAVRLGRPATGFSRLMATKWPCIFAACCAAWLALLPGVALLSYFFGIDHTDAILTIIAAAFGLLFLSYRSSIEHDRIELFQIFKEEKGVLTSANGN